MHRNYTLLKKSLLELNDKNFKLGGKKDCFNIL